MNVGRAVLVTVGGKGVLVLMFTGGAVIVEVEVGGTCVLVLVGTSIIVFVKVAVGGKGVLVLLFTGAAVFSKVAAGGLGVFVLVFAGMGELKTAPIYSYAPISNPVPCGRALPAKSMFGAFKEEPVSMAGEPS